MKTLAIACAAFLAAAAPAVAQTYPTRSITVVVPFPAGGPSDVVARIVTEHMGKVLGQAMVIENVGGAGGTIGSARVAAAAPDGYTLLAGSMGSHVAAPVLTPGIKYDSDHAFEPIGFTAHAPAVIVARKDLPPNTLAEFIAYVKQHGEDVRQAHGGVGSSSHMACVLFSAQAGLKPTQIAYRGTGPAMNDLIGGHVDYFCEQAVSVTGQINSGGDQGLCGVRAAAPSDAAGRADREGAWPRLPDGCLGRHLCAEGLAARRDRQARRCARQIARRSDRAEAARRSWRRNPVKG